MIFAERKVERGYTYDVEDVFGTIHIESPDKLEPDLLDDMVVLLLKQNLSAEVVEGEVQHKGGTVRYRFQKAKQWDEDDDDDDIPCADTPTSTKKQESASTPTSPSRTGALSWPRRFAGAFREAWKKTARERETDIHRT